MSSQRQHPFSSSLSPSPPLLLLPHPFLAFLIHPSTLPFLWMVREERTQDGTGASLPVWWRRAEEELDQVRPAETTSRTLQEGLPIPLLWEPGERTRNREKRGETREVKRTINNLLFVCFCFSCEGENAVVAGVVDKNTIMDIQATYKPCWTCFIWWFFLENKENWESISVHPPLLGRRVFLPSIKLITISDSHTRLCTRELNWLGMNAFYPKDSGHSLKCMSPARGMKVTLLTREAHFFYYISTHQKLLRDIRLQFNYGLLDGAF